MKLTKSMRAKHITLIFLLLISHAAGAGEIPFAGGDEITAAFDRGRSIVGADMDGDGDQDLLTAGPDTQNEVAWWDNTVGDGSSWVKRSIDAALPNASFALAVDLDFDGDMDVVATALGGGSLGGPSQVIFYENTDGIGTAWNTITVTNTLLTGADAAAVADIDADGDLDIFGGGMNTDDFYWFENTAGNGSAWTAHVIDLSFNGTRSTEAVDFDKDGDIDVVAAGEFEDEFAWFENPGPDMVIAAVSWTRNVINPSTLDGAGAVCTCDLDADGDLDVGAVADGTGANPEQVLWYENSGDNLTFTEHVIEAAFGRAHGIFCADMDGDGDQDIFAAGRTEEPNPAGAITWWENRLNEAETWVEHDVDDGFGGARSVWFGDLNGDGIGDAAGTGDNDKVIWYDNLSIHRNASFTEIPVDAAFTGARGVATADLECDSDGDVVAAGGDAVAWWAQESDGSWTETSIAASFTGAAGVDVGDVDADGDLDVIGAAETDGIAWFESTAGDGSAWTERTIDAAFAGARAVSLGDIDHDGTLDVAGAGFTAEEFAWWSNDSGDGLTWTKTSISSSRSGAISVQVVDLDGDGDLDVIGGAETDDDVLFFRNTAGDGSAWSTVVIDGSSDGINTVRAGDIDGDGDLDVVGVNAIADTVVWWENTSISGDGSTWSAAQTIDTFHNGALGLVLADFDADGDLDAIATQSKDGGKVTFYENVNDFANPWPAQDLATAFDGAAALAIGDLDANSQMDVVAVAETDGDVSYFPNRGGQFGLDSTNTAPVSLGDSVTDDVLRIVARHNGLVGEQDLELASFELLFEEVPADPLTTAEANSIVENLFIYRDANASGTWDSGIDTLVTTVGTMALDADGIQVVTFADADPNVQVAQGTPATFFVVLETTASYSSAGLTFFSVSHVTEGSSTAEDRTHDTPLLLEWAANVSSNLFEVNSGETSADLELTSITDSPDPVSVGGQVTYTVTVTNNGPWPAINVKVASTLPANTTFSSTAGCNEDPNGSPTCTLGSIGAGASDSFDITLDVDPAALGTVLTYQATVSSDTTEAGPGDESGSEMTTVPGEGDLEISTFAFPADYADGFPLYYVIRVTNLGPGDATGATVSNSLPTELTGKTWSCEGFDGGACAASGAGDISAEPVTLPVNGRVVFYAHGDVPASTTATLTNTATVSSSNDSDTGNNMSVTVREAGDWIFLDGFESGNTSVWSSTTP